MTDLTGNPATLDLTRAPFTPLTPVSDTVMNDELQQLLDNDASLKGLYDTLNALISQNANSGLQGQVNALLDLINTKADKTVVSALQAQVDDLYNRVRRLEQTGTGTPPPAGAGAVAADFTAVLNGAIWTFTGSGTSATGSAITTYQWTFGDGTAATGQSVTHSYAATGAYTVRLTVTAADGGSSSTSRAVQAAPTSGTSSSAAQTFRIAAGGGATLNTTAVTRAYFSLPGVPPGANVTVQSVTGNDRRATASSHDFYIRQGSTQLSIVTDNSAPHDDANNVYPLTPVPPFGLGAVACTNGTVELDFDYGDPAYLPSTRPALDLLDIVLHVSWSTP